jgi:hypothetical protein
MPLTTAVGVVLATIVLNAVRLREHAATPGDVATILRKRLACLATTATGVVITEIAFGFFLTNAALRYYEMRLAA